MKIKDNLHFLPNILSITRVVLTFVVIALMFIPSQIIYSFELDNKMICKVTATFFTGGIIFVIACITDFLDGFFARKYHWVSDFGKIWDAISDKILTTSVYICLTILELIPFYFVIILIFRDFVIDGYRMQSTKLGIIVPANLFGKIKTVLQMVSLILIFFVLNFPGGYQSHFVWYYLVQNLFVILATLASLISGGIYVIGIEKKMKSIKYHNKI